jgi:hypothetical protein
VPVPPVKAKAPPALAPVQAEYQTAAEAAASAAAKPAKAARRVVPVHELVKNRQSVRQGILLAEILGKPVALRDDF